MTKSEESLRDHAKRVVRELAELDQRAGIHRDGLQPRDLGDDGEAQAAVRVLGSSAYAVWLAAWDNAERKWLAAYYPTAAVLLELWAREWSTQALRYAAHRLSFVQSQGFDILEGDGFTIP